MGTTESPFAKHLSTNYIPKAHEVDQVKSLIGDRQKIVDGIDFEIAELQARVNALELRRKEHTDYIDEHAALLSPVRRLPADILASIFRAGNGWWKAYPHLYSQKAGLGRLPFAIALSQVCKEWRSLVLDMPEMWTHVEMRIPLFPQPPGSRGRLFGETPLSAAPPEEEQRQKEESIAQWKITGAMRLGLAELFIERSRERPLHIALLTEKGHATDYPYTDGDRDKIEAHKEQIKNLLLPTTNRWKTVDFEIHCNTVDSHLTELLRVQPDRLPLLRVAEVQARVRMDGAPFLFGMTQGAANNVANTRQLWHAQLPSFTLFSAPSLRALRLRLPWSDAERLPIGWSKLTKLDLDGAQGHSLMTPGQFTSREALALFAKCPRLVECTLNFMGTDIPTDGAPPPPSINLESPITLPDLRILNLHGYIQSPGLPKNLALPSLRHLSISLSVNVGGPADFDESGLCEWVTLYGEQLTTVAFDYSSLTQEALVRLLEGFPNVEHLHMFGLFQAVSRHGGLFGGNLNWGGAAQAPPPEPKKSAFLNGDVWKRFTPGSTVGGEEGRKAVGGVLCPKIKKLTVSVGEWDRGDEGLIECIAARRPAGAGGSSVGEGEVEMLQDVVIQFKAKGKTNMVREELQKRGIDTRAFNLKVRYGPEVLAGW